MNLSGIIVHAVVSGYIANLPIALFQLTDGGGVMKSKILTQPVPVGPMPNGTVNTLQYDSAACSPFIVYRVI